MKKFLSRICSVILVTGMFSVSAFAGQVNEKDLGAYYPGYLECSEGMFAVANGEKVGFLDKNGDQVIPFLYENVGEFSEGVAKVSKIKADEFGYGGKWGYIDKSGKEVISCIYDNAKEFSEGLAPVAKDVNGETKWGYIDQNGKTVLPFIYNGAEKFSEGLAAVSLGYDENMDPVYNYINKNGDVAFNTEFTLAFPFEDGYACGYARAGSPEESPWYTYSCFDKTGKVMISAPTYEVPDKSREEMRGVHEGKVALFNMGMNNAKDTAYYYDVNTGAKLQTSFEFGEQFSDGMAIVATGGSAGRGGYNYSYNDYGEGEFGYIDTTGKAVIPCKYEYARPFSEGYGVVWKDGKGGYIDKTGKIVGALEYDYVVSMNEGVALANKNNKTYLITIGNSVSTEKNSNSNATTNNTTSTTDSNTNSNTNKNINTNTNSNTNASVVTAHATKANVIVNGKDIAFEAYNILGNNYFKLRDIAQAISNTDSENQFSVEWDAEKKAVNMVTGKTYVSVGGELTTQNNTSAKAIPSTTGLLKDGEQVNISAYLICNNNYFKLRDLAELFGIEVAWDKATQTITISSGK